MTTSITTHTGRPLNGTLRAAVLDAYPYGILRQGRTVAEVDARYTDGETVVLRACGDGWAWFTPGTSLWAWR